MDEPAYFFVAHVITKHNGAKSQFANFKKLVPTATETYMVKSTANPLYVTFVATFGEAVDFESIKNKLPFTYGGKSKVLQVHYSTAGMPTYFYSAHLIQNFTPLQRHDGTCAKKQDLVRVALALISPSPVVSFSFYESSVLVEFTHHDLRPEDIQNINKVMLSMPHHAYLTSRET